MPVCVIVVDLRAKRKICVVSFSYVSAIFSAYATTLVFPLSLFVLCKLLHN